VRIFIGYDPRQPVALQVLTHSIYSRASGPVQIIPLVLSQLPIKRRGLTEFTFSRYLVPYLCGFEGAALFLDADMLVLDDIYKLNEVVKDNPEPVSMVKGLHKFEWPSLMYFNCAKCTVLTPEFIETDSPQKLDWADIGAIPNEWNHIVGYDQPNTNAKLVHFTQGIPCFPETKGCEYSDQWHKEMRKTISTVSWDDLMGGSVHAARLKPQVSFLHAGDESVASYRYRARIPAEQIGASINDEKAQVVIFAKPSESDVSLAKQIRAEGRKVVVDFCDDHFDLPHYQAIARLAHTITCPTQEMSERIGMIGYKATVIPDPYEYPVLPPHCNGENLLWFGHGSNIASFRRLGVAARCVSNVPGVIQWSKEIMVDEFAKADIVLMPATKGYKSPNRTVEAVRQGCFVVAEPHPSLNHFPGIWIGDIKEGIAWASENPEQVINWIARAQQYTERFSPEHVGNAWKKLLTALNCTSAAGTRTGTDG
jgi:hypothetical protein